MNLKIYNLRKHIGHFVVSMRNIDVNNKSNEFNTVESELKFIGDGFFSESFLEFGRSTNVVSTFKVSILSSKEKKDINSDLESNNYDGFIHIEKSYDLLNPKTHILIFNDVLLNLMNSYDDYVEITLSTDEIKLKINNDNPNIIFGTFNIRNFTTENNSKTSNIEINNHKLTEIRYGLYKRYCGNQLKGQIPTICDELSYGFLEISDKDEIKNKISILDSLFFHLKFHIQTEFDKKIFNSKLTDEEIKKILHLKGDEFEDECEKLSSIESGDIKEKYNELFRHNTYSEILFLNKFKPCEEINFIMKEYLSLNNIKSKTLEQILVDVSISSTLLNFFNYSDAKHVDILKLDITPDKIQNNKFKTIINVWMRSILGYISSGLMWWWLTSLIFDNTSLSRYIIFASLFTTERIISHIVLLKISIEKNNPNNNDPLTLIKELCLLHHSVRNMNKGLLKSILYKIGSKGINFNDGLYEILDR